MADTTDLARRIAALPLPEKLELAAGLIRAGKLDLAQSVVDRAGNELVELRVVRAWRSDG